MSQPTPPADPVPGTDTRQQIDDEHRHLNGLLAELTATSELARIERLLGSLRELLVKHFETEEAPQGLHEIVSAQAAHRLPNLQKLFDEHREILDRVDRLREATRACLDGPVRRVLDDVGALARTLHEHEAEEEELFGEAFYTDLGGRA